MSHCNATLNASDQPSERRCDYVMVRNHLTEHCPRPAPVPIKLTDGSRYDYCEFHAGLMALHWIEYNEHLEKWGEKS